MKLKLKLVESSYIYAIGIDSKEKTLNVIFLSEKKELHIFKLSSELFSVTQTIWEKEPAKIGKFFANFIRPRYYHIDHSIMKI